MTLSTPSLGARAESCPPPSAEFDPLRATAATPQPPADVSDVSDDKQQQGEDEDSILTLVAHPSEHVWQAQLGNLQSFFGPKIRHAVVHVPPVTSSTTVSGLISTLFLFPRLCSLHLSIAKPTLVLETRLFCAIAELSGLRQCRLEGGTLPDSALNLEVLSSLRKLEDLQLSPSKHDGLDDEHMGGLACLSTTATLRSLSFRASVDNFTDQGLQHLSALHRLTQLQILPLGLGVTREGVTRLLSSLTGLESLGVGVTAVGQVGAVRDCGGLQRMVVVANDPDASSKEWSSLVTTCTLCLSTSLVTLRLGMLKMQDSAFLLALATLCSLTELKFAVAPASLSTPSFACELSVLSNLVKLEALDVAVSARLAMPFTPRSVSLAVLAWPRLSSLSLSVMGREELVPEALALLDLLISLRSLSLFCPLDFNAEDDDPDVTAECVQSTGFVPLCLKYMPHGLTSLQLEHAVVQLQQQGPQGAKQPQPPSSTSASSCALTNLRTLELDDCTCHDATLQAVAKGAPRLRRLELNSVEGLSGQGLCDVLAHLSCLEHLAVVCSVSGGGGRNRGDGEDQQRWVEQLPAALASSAHSLVHVEWSPTYAPLSGAQLRRAANLFSTFSSLRFLYVHGSTDAAPLRSEAQAQRSGSEAGGSSAGGAPGVGNGGGSFGGSSSWVSEVQRRLPVCIVTDELPRCLLQYDVFSDAFVGASGLAM